MKKTTRRILGIDIFNPIDNISFSYRVMSNKTFEKSKPLDYKG